MIIDCPSSGMWAKQLSAVANGALPKSEYGPFPYCFPLPNITAADPKGKRSGPLPKKSRSKSPLRGGQGGRRQIRSQSPQKKREPISDLGGDESAEVVSPGKNLTIYPRLHQNSFRCLVLSGRGFFSSAGCQGAVVILPMVESSLFAVLLRLCKSSNRAGLHEQGNFRRQFEDLLPVSSQKDSKSLITGNV